MMKQMKYMAGILLLLLLVACSKDDYLRYDTSTASLRFVYKEAGNDSVVYSFGVHPGENEGEVEIPFSLIGLASSQARTIGLEVVADETTAQESVDYELIGNELPANSVKHKLKVKVIRNAALDAVPEEGKPAPTRVLMIRLCANENFAAAPINGATFRIIITNELTKPEGWIFDEYSRVKHEFVIKHTGVATDYNSVWNNSEQIRWKGVLINALYEYNKAHPGDPLKDENGMLITF